MSKKDPVILITNDDGVQSPGLKKIHSLISRYSKNVIIVAPSKNCSGSGHSITLANPIRINKISNNFYSCTGTPTDCILLGIQEVLKGKKPDLIISGINIGANLGDDVTYSGTVSAAMEGALLGINSLALSVAVKNTILTSSANLSISNSDWILLIFKYVFLGLFANCLSSFVLIFLINDLLKLKFSQILIPKS